MSYVLKLENISLIYKSSESLSFKHLLGLRKKSVINSHQALNDVSLTIEKGLVYGIIGNNGAGKSTLLRIMSGVMAPNSGVVLRNHNTVNLLALGIGFTKEISGLDNIYLNGMLLGFSKKQIDGVLNDIITFSELGDFIYRLMKTYSSGMVSRLGFSIAIHLRPEILLIDEVLSVGDAKFREKSYNALHSIIKDKDTTVVIVSHSTGQLEAICDKMIWLDKGKVIAKGEKEDVLKLYARFNRGELKMQDVHPLVESIEIDGDGGFSADISNYSLFMENMSVLRFTNRPVDYVREYISSAGTLKLTKRVLDNNDIFIFFEYSGKEMELTVLTDEITEVIQHDHLYKKPPFDNRYGENRLTGLSSYLDLRIGSAIISKVIYYRELTKAYSDGTRSAVYELVSESSQIEIEKKGKIHINILLQKNERVSFFVLLSKEKLFKSRDNFNKYMEQYYQSVYNNSIQNSFFTMPSGTYTKLPYSIEPFTRSGYGYSLHHSSKKEMFPFYRETNERFYEDFILNAVYQTYLYQKRDNGAFLTSYTSTWVKNELGTGITAPYVDTRLNETFILMLQDFQKVGKYFKELDPMKDYVNFLYSKYMNKIELYKAGDGIFFPDYFKTGANALSHASMNHQLGIAHMMYKAYESYGDERYLDVFRSIVLFLEKTEINWYREDNGDLFYGVKLGKDGGYEYFGKDYVYVTLDDLLLLQIRCLKLEKVAYSKAVESLITHKINYLNGTEYGVFNENSKPAPGENINSRVYTVDLYKQLEDEKLKRNL